MFLKPDMKILKNSLRSGTKMFYLFRTCDFIVPYRLSWRTDSVDCGLYLKVTARKRAKNSALEVDLDFEHNVRPAPVITEEVTATLEELIQKRILEVVPLLQ